MTPAADPRPRASAERVLAARSPEFATVFPVLVTGTRPSAPGQL